MAYNIELLWKTPRAFDHAGRARTGVGALAGQDILGHEAVAGLEEVQRNRPAPAVGPRVIPHARRIRSSEAISISLNIGFDELRSLIEHRATDR